MDPQQLAEFVSHARSAISEIWEEAALRGLSTRTTPADVLGSQAWLLEADIKITWVRWFVEGLVDYRRFVVDDELGYSFLYHEVTKRLHVLYPTTPRDELRRVALATSELIWEEIVRRRGYGRQRVGPEVRESLWLQAEPDPRCYLCGYRFTDGARDRFLDRAGARAATESELPLLIDLTRPRGLVRRDVEVEVDHVYPVAHGGNSSQGNLRLSCGWCNKVKSDRRTLYESQMGTSTFAVTHSHGKVSIPQPLWVVRIVATRRRCEHYEGCARRLHNSELFFAPRDGGVAVNPVNSGVYCKDHDPWATIRYIGRRVFKPK